MGRDFWKLKQELMNSWNLELSFIVFSDKTNTVKRLTMSFPNKPLCVSGATKLVSVERAKKLTPTLEANTDPNPLLFHRYAPVRSTSYKNNGIKQNRNLTASHFRLFYDEYGESVVDTNNTYVLKKFTDDKIDCGIHETAALQFINHSNVIELIHSVLEPSENSVYLVTDQCELGNMTECLSDFRESDRFRSHLVRNYFKQIVESVAHLHAIGVAHQDICAENVVVSADHIVKLIDFEFAIYSMENNMPVLWHPLTRRTGKLLYWSPEVFDLELYDESRTTRIFNPFAKDIWALGVLLFYMITGEYIFHDNHHCPSVSVNHPLKEAFQFRSSEDIQFLLGKHCIRDTTGVDTPLLDLMKLIFKINPADRITAEQILQHEWFTSGPSTVEVVVV